MLDTHPRRIRAALFLDFDAVYLGLQSVDPDAAKRFSEQPGRWLGWMERGSHATTDGREGRARRTLLLRRCYINLSEFWNFRNGFLRSGFSVVDCPMPISGGPTGAGVSIAMDACDALAHGTNFDEFILLTSGTDFTSLLLRIRAHDRRTALLAHPVDTPALSAACTYRIDRTVFMETALVEAPAAAPANRLSMRPSAPGAPPPAPFRSFAPRPAPTGDYDVLPEVAAALRDVIEQDGPIPAAELPHFFFRFPGFRNSDWFGFRSLRRLAEALTTVDSMLLCGEPGQEWQMALRDGPLPAASEGGSHRPEPAANASQLAAMIDSVHEATGVPALPSDAYDLIFEHMAKMFEEGVAEPTEMAQTLQDKVRGDNMSLSDEDAHFVVSGLWRAGFDSAADSSDPDIVAQAFRDYVAVLCEQAGRALGPDELPLVNEWLVGA